jgi:DNA-binding response OmpR family regulator
MTKPVLLKELDARIRSLLRRSQGLTASDELIIDNIIINPVQQLLTIVHPNNIAKQTECYTY